MKDENCIFCKLANGDIPTNTLYEDEEFRVIMDAAPAAKGHALVIPKEHFENVFEISDNIVANGAKVAKKMASKMISVLHCDGVNILQNNGEASGQTVFHYHVHIIPRFEGDSDRVRINWDHLEYSSEETDHYVKVLKAD